MKYHAPNDEDLLNDPTVEQMERILRTSPHSHWQQGGNGEAILHAGAGGPSLWIKQPEPERFFFTFTKPPGNWLAPFDGGSCESLIEDERGGDAFWIPRACLVAKDEDVEIVSCFLTRGKPSPRVPWRYQPGECDQPQRPTRQAVPTETLQAIAAPPHP